MGVPRLVKIILEKYKKSHQHVDGQVIQYFYMDFNPIIYSCYYDFCQSVGNKIQHLSQATIERGIIEHVIAKTKHMITDVVKPTKLVYIAIDGPAPRSKMIQQRHRRYRKILENKIKSDLKTQAGIYDKEPWDTSNITPGTKFMEKLSIALRKAARFGQFSVHHPIDVIVSDSNVPGEGEHKFLHHIGSLKTKPGEKVCIFSNDGDLLILGNRFCKDKEVYILTQPNKTSKVVKEFYLEDEFMYILLNEFQDGFIEELKLQDYERDRVIYDYIFFTFFGGNDFIMHFPFTMMKEFRTFNLLSRIYKMLLEEYPGEYLIEYDPKEGTLPKVNTKFFKSFITELAKREEYGMRNKQKRYNNSSPSKEGHPPGFEELESWEQYFIQLQNKYFFKEDHPLYEEEHKKFQIINYEDEKKNWKPRYYKYFFGIDTENSYHFRQQTRIIGLQYVKSLFYTLYYYLDEVPSWRWYYPYRMAPFPSDIQSALHHIDDINTIFKFEKGYPFKPYDQLMLVLPPQNQILPRSYRELQVSEGLKEFYPQEFELDVLQGEKFIYSEPLLPEIHLGKVFKAIAEVEKTLPEADKKRNSIRKTITYIPAKKQKQLKVDQ